eukprot:jgi/Botrbrau1/15989/Bobra.0241s0001.2
MLNHQAQSPMKLSVWAHVFWFTLWVCLLSNPYVESLGTPELLRRNPLPRKAMETAGLSELGTVSNHNDLSPEGIGAPATPEPLGFQVLGRPPPPDDSGPAVCVDLVGNVCEMYPSCADFLTDVENCGSCGEICRGGYPVCTNGVCYDNACYDPSGGFCPADQNGVCPDFRYDAQNCGSCGNVCPGPSAFCTDYQCYTEIVCYDRGGNPCPGDGLSCPDFLSDYTNCGFCRNECGSGVCVSGNCGCTDKYLNTCEQGIDGCDFSSDIMNCGSCNNVCGDGTACVEGSCVDPCYDPSGGNCPKDQNGFCPDYRYDPQ